MSPGAVEAVLQDSRGFLWFGTTHGLDRYDGFEFVRYEHSPDDPGSITNGDVLCIEEDASGNLWVGTGGGLNRFDRQAESFERFEVDPESEDALHSYHIQCLHFDGDEQLWIGTLGGSVHRLDPKSGTFDHFYFEGGDGGGARNEDNIGAITQDIEGRIWVGTVGGGVFYRSDFGDWVRVVGDIGDERIGSARVHDLLGMDDGSVLVGTDRGVWKVVLADGEARVVRDFAAVCAPLEGVRIDSLLVDRDGTLWIGTDGGGVFLCDMQTDRYRQMKKRGQDAASLSSDVVRRIVEDGSGDIWLGHYPKGVSHASRLNAAFTTIRRDPWSTNSLVHDSVTGFAEDEEGGLWITTDGGGVSHWDRAANRFTHHRFGDPSGLSAGGALSAMVDRNGSLWVGTYAGGLNRLDRGAATFRRYLPDAAVPGSLSDHHVFCMLEDREGTLWFGTMDGGLNRYVPETDSFVHYTGNRDDETTLASSHIWTLYEDRDGVVWAGTSLGFSRYERDRDSFTSFRFSLMGQDTLSNEWVSAFVQDRLGRIWVGTLGAGLFEFDETEGFLRRVSLDDGLSSDMVCGILEDDDGFLWVSTFDGITRFDPRSGNCDIYDEKNGLPGRQFNRFSAALKSRNGELLFGAVEGLLIVDPRRFEPNLDPPPVRVTGLKLDNQSVKPGVEGSPLATSIVEADELELPWGHSVIEFQFAALNYRAPERNIISFKLDGVDDDWRTAGKDQTGLYLNLDPGRYVLRVRGANNAGVWSEGGVAMPVAIVPPFWLTPWFKTLVIVAVIAVVLAIGWAIARARMLKLLVQAEHERELAEERQAMHDALRQSQKMEAIGTLAGGIAHDFNNILAGIMAYLHLVLEAGRLAPEDRSDLVEVEGLAHRAKDLVRQILTYSRKEKIGFEPVDVVAAARGGLKLLRATLPQSIRIEEELPETPCMILGSETQIHQIIVNLGMNAAHAMPADRGKISVSIEEAVRREDGLERPQGSKTYVVRFRDDGSGMSEETVERLFDPFFTTKPRERGTGLGMSVVFGIVKSHDAVIDVSSRLGEGAEFVIEFPAAPAGTVSQGRAQPEKTERRAWRACDRCRRRAAACLGDTKSP